jgi:lipopolysaccharide export system protein LptA
VERGQLTMGGNVVLTRGETVIRGQRLELNLETGFTSMDGAPTTGGVSEGNRVRARFSVPGRPPAPKP